MHSITYQVGLDWQNYYVGLDWQNIKLKAYALLMPLLIDNFYVGSSASFLSWEFCSNGTTCMCIVESHLELYIISCYVDVLVD